MVSRVISLFWRFIGGCPKESYEQDVLAVFEALPILIRGLIISSIGLRINNYQYHAWHNFPDVTTVTGLGVMMAIKS